MRIVPTSKQIDIWIKKFVPEKDLFFIDEHAAETFGPYLNDVLVIPKEEFLNHLTYMDIHYINSYMYWSLSKKVEYVIVAEPSWITSLPLEERKDLITLQSMFGTGLTFPFSLFSSLDNIPSEYVVSKGEHTHEYIKMYIPSAEAKLVVLRKDLWNNLPHEIKEKAIINYAQLVHDWNCYDPPSQTPIHIKKYANQFATIQGSNCFAATLYAITKVDWFINEWVLRETLLKTLAQYKYILVDDQFRKGDVVTWVNSDGLDQHAAYHIEDNLFFNKNDQTFFSPWEIVHFEQINKLWNNCKVNVYRKTS